ncbi:hypothetical protein [Oceanicella sp. SM1341]|uniref:hypothetical protein n=1 Tax=Oceanicella sp. SM1341 TaxID=1548889 RepID=UPI001300AE61|nr:hypothetical protein [Oceanicella sp. SM1341]
MSDKPCTCATPCAARRLRDMLLPEPGAAPAPGPAAPEAGTPAVPFAQEPRAGDPS